MFVPLSKILSTNMFVFTVGWEPWTSVWEDGW